MPIRSYARQAFSWYSLYLRAPKVAITAPSAPLTRWPSSGACCPPSRKNAGNSQPPTTPPATPISTSLSVPKLPLLIIWFASHPTTAPTTAQRITNEASMTVPCLEPSDQTFRADAPDRSALEGTKGSGRQYHRCRLRGKPGRASNPRSRGGVAGATGGTPATPGEHRRQMRRPGLELGFSSPEGRRRNG